MTIGITAITSIFLAEQKSPLPLSTFLEGPCKKNIYLDFIGQYLMTGHRQLKGKLGNNVLVKHTATINKLVGSLGIGAA